MAKMAQHFDWKLLNLRFPHADDMVQSEAYMDMYLESRDAVKMADTKAILDQLLARKDDSDKLLWWWCDALFMASPVMARMSAAIGDRRYVDAMARK